MSATVSQLIPRRLQNFDSIQIDSAFVPLLELQDQQHLAMFSGVTILSSLMICSHVPTVFREPSARGASSIATPQ